MFRCGGRVVAVVWEAGGASERNKRYQMNDTFIKQFSIFHFMECQIAEGNFEDLREITEINKVVFGGTKTIEQIKEKLTL